MLNKSRIFAAGGMLLLTLGLATSITTIAGATTVPSAAWTTPATSPLNNGLSSMAYGNGHYVAVSAYQGAMYSTDGITWTAVTLQAHNDGFYNVTFGGGLFMAIGQSGAVATSTDGTSWTVLSSQLPCAGPVLHGVCYSDDTNWQSVTYGAGKFVAVQYGGSDAYSTDGGATWQSGDLSASYNWQSVTYGDGKFVAVAYNGPGVGVSYSTDGITWTTQNLNTGSFSNVVYGDGKFVAVERNAPYDSAVSTDGVNWTISPNALPTFAIDLAFGDGYFIAVGGFNTQVSLDGLTWTEMANATSNQHLTFGDHQFVAGRSQDNATSISRLVLPVPTTTTTTAVPVVLSRTGSNVQSLLKLGGVMLSLGAILLLAGRRQLRA
jgi:hypothetical protein